MHVIFGLFFFFCCKNVSGKIGNVIRKSMSMLIQIHEESLLDSSLLQAGMIFISSPTSCRFKCPGCLPGDHLRYRLVLNLGFLAAAFNRIIAFTVYSQSAV